MQPLDKTLRNQLEKTVKEAREIAESAARAALEQLGVGEVTPFSHLTDAEKEFRRKLRIHARQLGDSLNGGKTQSMDRLIEEVAYEHWHRMLFARFLAENNLLIYDGVAITLEECEELAIEANVRNGWAFAAICATRMLPQIFRLDSPVFAILLPPEHQQKLEQLLSALPLETFTASDSLGWVYQFWQAKRKEEVNKSEVKIGAQELPAVTQLFTEPYMVAFLLDNSLGAWWAGRCLSDTDLNNSISEDELRKKASLPGMSLEYLRFIKAVSGAWTPAAGTFDGWPKNLADLKLLDPCCGSGHFIVAVLLMLVPIRMAQEKLSARETIDKVISENIHGLELDKRCVELAAFALALAAWRYPEAGGYRKLPELNVACSGLSLSVKKDEWLAMAQHAAEQLLGNADISLFPEMRDQSVWHTQLVNGMTKLYDEFLNAPVLGSLLNPKAVSGDMFAADFEQLHGLLYDALLKTKSTEEEGEIGIVAYGMSKAASLLANNYHLVVANVPYLARGKQNDLLRDYCEEHYPEAKNDLATVFLDRCLEFCKIGGTTSIVLPQNWLFLTGYKKFREKLLKDDSWNTVVRLGEGGFDSSAAAGAFTILITMSRGQIHDSIFIRGLDVSEPREATEKAMSLISTEVQSFEQKRQLDNPDAIVSFNNLELTVPRLKEFADIIQGVSTTDAGRFLLRFWETFRFNESWEYYQIAPSINNLPYTSIMKWEQGLGALAKIGTAHKGKVAIGRKGISVAVTRTPIPAMFIGSRFDGTGAVILPKDPLNLLSLVAYVWAPEFAINLRVIDQALSITESSFGKVPFDLAHWQKVAAEKYPNGLPKPYSDDPTQWVFHGHPCGSVIWDEDKKWTARGPLRTDETVLQVAIARLLGYQWPAELDTTMDLSDESRELVKKTESLLSFIDNDGIVCIPAVRGEASAADRLLNLLAASYGDSWSNEILNQLLISVDHAGKTIETWLRDKFFLQHCKLFQHRPFIWQVWDGLRDGFSALVNYHKFDAKLLETLIYTYLGDWITRQKQDKAQGVDGAEEKIVAAEQLKKKLELIREGDAPYDIFVRWKSLEQQPIGWNPDLNDGVRMNIRPFMTAGVLRFNKKPQVNITWDKDRGRDVDSAPWFAKFGGDRINDCHLTIQEKSISRYTKENARA